MSIKAFIDLGTNTFHCLIVDIKSELEYHIIKSKSVFVKIGNKGFSNIGIHPEAIARADKAINLFRSLIKDAKVEEVFVVATSAIRNAKNKNLLIRPMTKLGWDVKVIDGIREAELIYKGILLDEKLILGQEPFLTMDIGGGSVEFSLATHSKLYWSRSFEIGAQRLKDNFHHSDPISTQEIDQLKRYLETELLELFIAASSFKPMFLIGSSGTFDTLIENQKFAGMPDTNRLNYPTFESFSDKVIQSNLYQRIKIPGIHEERAEMLVVALILLEVVLKKLNLKTVLVSNNALKEGLLFEALERIKK